MSKNIPPIADQIAVSALPTYLAEQSEANAYRFIWAYEIEIFNNSAEPVQLLGRCWQITSMSGRVDVVKGAGVIGLQPLIQPGKRFYYTSFCELTTPQGTMEGYYEMQTVREETFTVNIPKFILSSPTKVLALFKQHLH